MKLLWLTLCLALSCLSPSVFACPNCAKADVVSAAPIEASAPFDIGGSDTFLGFFRKLLATDFMPHGHCFWWKPEIVWLHVLSDLFIALAYYSIPISLIYFARRRKDIPFPFLFSLFAGFILWCGTTHVLNIVTLWIPVYRLDGVVKAITAGISVYTAFVLFPVIPKALTLRSPGELEAKNRELEEAYRKLQGNEELKSQFLANVSHELRTPLTLMLAPMETILGDKDLPPEKKRRLLGTVHDNTVRLLEIIGSLLDFSKVESGKIEVHPEPVDMTLLVGSVVNDFRPATEAKQLQLEFDPTPLKQTIRVTDRYLVERIVFNLLSNALKFTERGGKIEVRMEDTEGDNLALTVKDTGIGIAPEHQQVLFQRFRQVEGSSTRRFEGTGLGLALTKEFCQQLGATISVESELGKGSVFKVVLQASPPANGELPAPLEKRPWPVASSTIDFVPGCLPARKSGAAGEPVPRILVAEDNVGLAQYVATLLEPEYEVRVARDGEEAWALVQRWVPHLVLSDVMMPKSDGLELCRKIKGNQRFAFIPVLLLTAVTRREAVLKGWEAGADEYLMKPFHPVELTTRIKTLLKVVEVRDQAKKERRRVEELEQFAYIASHDLKEPLRTVVTFGQLLNKKYAKEISGEAEEYIGFMVESANRMKELITDLVSYSSLEGQKEVGREAVDMNRALQRARENLRVAIDESGALIRHAPLPSVEGFSAQVTLLFQNLLSNAIKFRSDRPIEIEVTGEEQGDELVFSVRDNGQGFDPQYAERIFLLFKRLHDRETYPGTGVGLAICKRIVERLGGRIWAESTPGNGATFYFTVPLQPGEHSV